MAMTGRNDYQRPLYAGGAGQFTPAYHLEMISDGERVGQIMAALDSVLKSGDLFCELGTGTGLFSIYAARTARHVYTVEIDPATAAIARKNIATSGLSHKITLIEGDATRCQLPEPVDVVLCEMLSTALIEEPAAVALDHARRRLLKPGGTAIPGKVHNLVELCQMQYRFGGVEARTHSFEFAGIRRARTLSTSTCYHSVDFGEPLERLDVQARAPIQVVAEGTANAARLTSIVELAPGVVFHATDSLMPPIVLPLTEEVHVRPGRVNVNICHAYRVDLGTVHVWVDQPDPTRALPG
jgi:predicted RNA methylase